MASLPGASSSPRPGRHGAERMIPPRSERETDRVKWYAAQNRLIMTEIGKIRYDAL
jgi:hypothetical protein